MQAGAQQLTFPIPGRVLKTVLGVIFAVWLIFALALNWGNVSLDAFLLFANNTDGLLHGQLWRLLTAPWLTQPNSAWDVIGSMLGLYFLGSPLEKKWGPKRFISFLVWVSILSYAVSFAMSLVLPSGLMAKLDPLGFQFGPGPVVYGVAIAWACSFKGSQVLMLMVMPISSRMLIWLTVGMATLSLIAQSAPTSGHIASFAGMGLGYLLGGGSPSPLRRALLRYRLASLERSAAGEKQQRRNRGGRGGLKVIPGGKDDDPPKNRILH